ncbi:Heat shock protein 70 lhs1 [Neolecta irregularis DAH-3]|uniref:Heat shock protein 70 lhs1 n=1 Tax=Neolecta irregularis (strain DAH-3) TaxID=1198029 RepID=A0A1U7LM52_NEOID|nr:Heat shock protein 70 lhs1 [Neolecta irregularis DAH-3]|eukprot:OLL23735.1 Heat shock protein 70 lhs1 [Neolecta irregularis DAH-3]
MTDHRNKLLLSLFVFSLLFHVAQAAAMAIDYGQEWTKQAMVKHGSPLDIVLTKDSKRKEQSVIAFKGEELSYGSDAANLASRFPSTVYISLKPLVGKTIGQREVTEFQRMNPQISVKDQLERPAISLSREDEFLAIEELVALQFANSKALVQNTAKEAVKKVVVTVPPFFSQSERQAIIDAVQISGLKLLALINDGTAVALNYAYSRSWDPEERYHIVYDMGAGSTSATLVSFKTTDVPDVGKYTKNIVAVDVLGAAWDRSLGGDLLTDRLTEILVVKFEEMHGPKVKVSIRDSPKALSKLRKEALRVKQILSANQEVAASVESLHEDIDFRAKVTRSEFEITFAELTTRVVAPIDDALKVAGIPLSNIDSVLLAGGGIRVPFIQKILEEHVGESKISKNINADEAAVMGAVFRAAVLSGQFKTKDVRIHDKAQYDVSLTHDLDNGDKMTQNLFGVSTDLGTSKTISFEKNVDFSFSLFETDTNNELLTITITGITDALEKIKKEGKFTELNVDVTIEINENGILNVLNSTLTCETDEETGFSDKVKSLFGLKGKKPKTTSSITTESLTETAVADNEKEDQVEDTGPPEKSVTIPLKWFCENQPIRAFNAAEQRASSAKLRALEKKDKERVDREEARNSLEGYLYRVREYSDDQGFIEATTSETIEIFKQKIDKANDWINMKGDVASLKELKSYMKELINIESPISLRKLENANRPEALKKLADTLKSTKGYFEVMLESAQQAAEKETTKSSSDKAPLLSPMDPLSSPLLASSPRQMESHSPDKYASPEWNASPEPSAPSSFLPPLNIEDLVSSIGKITELEIWLEERTTRQNILKPYQDPVLTVKDIEQQAEKIQRILLDALMNKKKKPTPKKKVTSSSASSSQTSTMSADHDEL